MATTTTAAAAAAHVAAQRAATARRIEDLDALAADPTAERTAAARAALAAETGRRNRMDDTDAGILAERIAALLQRTGPEEGDFVDYPDGTVHRIASVWPDRVQTTRGGSFHLGTYGASYSGSLFSPIPADTLTDTGTRRDGSVWFFHHDRWKANNGRDGLAPFRVWSTTAPVPAY